MKLTFGCFYFQKYLTDYGYLDPDKNCTEEDIRAGLRKFQELNINFKGIQITGTCDRITKLVMELPRCGCEDIVKGDQKIMPAQNLLDGPLEYRTFPTKWSKRSITWTVSKYPINNRQLTNTQVDDAMQRALDIWAKQTSLSFSKETGTARPDIVISFEVRRHTSSEPFYDFDGNGGVLAHAFSPESGVVHFDDEEQYTLGNNQGTELYIVAAHEFGHTLGISHSNIQEALMAPYYRYSDTLQLHSDDIAAIQSLYGGRSEPQTTPRPAPTTRSPIPTTKAPDTPDYCNIEIAGTFKIDYTIYTFSRERVSSLRSKTFVYLVDSSRGIGETRIPIEELFVRNDDRTYPRAYPYRVDAAAYIPNRRYVFLFSGTRAYRYTKRGSKFYLDDGFPRWMDVSEFPERPRAAIAMPYGPNYPNNYYMLIFGTTMVWDWNFYSERVGAWAYPIEVFGRTMPLRTDSAYLNNDNEAMFIKGDQMYKFSMTYRRVMDDADSVLSVKKDFLKGQCA